MVAIREPAPEYGTVTLAGQEVAAVRTADGAVWIVEGTRARTVSSRVALTFRRAERRRKPSHSGVRPVRGAWR